MHCDNFLSNAAGVVPWRERSAQHRADKSSTMSDEAFCIVTLINNCQHWTDEFKGAKEKIGARQRTRIWTCVTMEESAQVGMVRGVTGAMIVAKKSKKFENQMKDKA